MSDHVESALPLRLVAESGPPAPEFEVFPGRFTRIGRAIDCEVCLPDPVVSRHHAAVIGRGGRWFVTDLESRAGTLLNGVAVLSGRPTPLASEDRLRIGPWTLRVVMEGGWAQEQEAVVAGRLGVTTALLDEPAEGDVEVRAIRRGDLQGIAQQRLGLLLEYAGELNGASDEGSLADIFVRCALSGTGYRRGGVLRASGSAGELMVMSGWRSDGVRETGFAVSRSLVQQAEGGAVASLSPRQPKPTEYSMSIAELDIHSALCVPVEMEGSIGAFLYLDARAGESRVTPDAADFCLALARLYALALSNLRRAALEGRRRDLEAQLNAAREAQQLITPPGAGRVGVFEYAVRATPGMIVAGDLFDVVPVLGGRVAVCIGDVTGAGVGAGIIMACAQSHLNACLRHHSDPAQAVRDVNRYLVSHSVYGRLVSLWVGVFDAAARSLSYVDAGHGHWLLVRSGERPRTLRGAGGIPLGIEGGARYESVEIPFDPGDRVVLFTDGVVEQRNTAGEEFGLDRVISLLSENGCVEHDAARVMDAMEVFVGSRLLNDDTTIVSVGYAAGT